MALTYHRIGGRTFTKEYLDEIEKDARMGVCRYNIEESELTPADIVREFKESGKHFNLDYPGGILQFVKDFEDGKLNYKPM